MSQRAVAILAFASVALAAHAGLADESEDGGADAETDAASDAGASVDASTEDASVAQEPNEVPFPTPQPPRPDRRAGGELVLLYFASIAWGGSISLFVDGLTYADNVYAKADFAGILLAPVTAGIGLVLPTVVDMAYGHRPGAAQTVTSGLLLGLGEGVALNEYFSNRSDTSFHTFTKDAAWIFGGMTFGLASGLAVAGFVRATPGRAAWVETTGLFSGMFAASVAGAASRPSTTTFDRAGRRDVGITGALAGAAGIAVGISTATWMSPSILRVHLIDLGWIAGMSLSALACNRCQAPDTFLAMAVGGGFGFVGTFLATIPLAADRNTPNSAPTISPYAAPLPQGGFQVGIGGAL